MDNFALSRAAPPHLFSLTESILRIPGLLANHALGCKGLEKHLH
jgi:hypothetical protein